MIFDFSIIKKSGLSPAMIFLLQNATLTCSTVSFNWFKSVYFDIIKQMRGTGDGRTQSVRKAGLAERSHGESQDPEKITPISQVSQVSYAKEHFFTVENILVSCLDTT